MNTIDDSSGDSGRKPPSSFRHGEFGMSTENRITAVSSSAATSDQISPRFSSGSSSALISVASSSPESSDVAEASP